MTLDPHTLLAILGMALATYATRLAGLALAGRLQLSSRAQAAFDAIPPAVLVAVIAPSALATGWPETAAALLAALAATRLP
ncbi:MAG: AzlD domain-containing protein, partial [Beijerinckiaceae bacterium]|nr:AzlD domain-containing protein [Beijerinckiaceae bacterium]